jgi:hypothetical protein
LFEGKLLLLANEKIPSETSILCNIFIILKYRLYFQFLNESNRLN